ncbi:acyltransferase [Tardiphaga sp. 709]|uniref:acyltransferase family protein n=1 Tax=Tardiphaga sp. 709 TaxID=3076039 RepID=UPI0028E81698|nr:acyltransferase [Tardiphaga sp. 709]WNV12817.1 acyltransferase [Tardiphaga sp. 709]
MLASDRQGASRVQALDLLRLIAVAAVLFYHYGFWGPSSHDVPRVALPWMASFAQYGFLGVPVFFIISGFVIAYSAEGRTATGFAIARFSRIYPTFLFCMTLTFLAILTLGPPHFDTSFAQWCANLFVAAPALGHSYMDGAYWSLVIELSFYAWVAVLMAAKVFPRRLDHIILIWLGITFANELTIDAPIFEKLFLADDSGFFAVGLVIYEFFRGRRDPKLYAVLALSVGTAVFQSLHKLIRLGPHTGGTFDHAVVVAICLGSIAIIFAATRLRRVPLPAGLVVAIGGLTYPLYLLHMQLGYVFLMRFSSTDAVWAVSIIISGLVLLSWIVWRFIERPAHRWAKDALIAQAIRRGLEVTVARIPEPTAIERSPA